MPRGTTPSYMDFAGVFLSSRFSTLYSHLGFLGSSILSTLLSCYCAEEQSIRILLRRSLVFEVGGYFYLAGVVLLCAVVCRAVVV